MKTLKDVIDAQPANKEKYLTTVKKILSSCVTKTLLMFSLVHKIFAEYFINCDAKEKLEMIDMLGEHLINMVHTKDGTEVALQCIWFGTAKVICLFIEEVFRNVLIKGFKILSRSVKRLSSQ